MTLLEEIQAKCSPVLIASREHGAIAEVVSLGRTKTQMVKIADVQSYLQANGLWWAIKGASADDLHPANAAAVAVMDVANARYEVLEMTLPIIGQMRGGLVATGLMAQANLDALMALGVVPAPVTCPEIVTAMEGLE